jgi:ferric-chelate reductase (NADPH)
MRSLSEIVSNTVERLLFRPVTITSVEGVGERFRMLSMKGEGFKGVKWVPGQAIQIFLGNLTKRAYTPMDLDAVAGSACFLIYLHGNGPGSEWAECVKAGDMCQVMRPKDSINFQSITEPALFFGDETSLAAAQALHCCEGQLARSQFVLEVNSPAEVGVVLDKLGIINRSLIQKGEDGGHLARVVSKLAEQAGVMHSPQWVFTGQARSIQTIRKGLNQAGIALSKSKVRAYWSPGKTGMD